VWQWVTGTADRVSSQSRRARFPLEVAVVWAIFTVVTVEILVTYSRLPAGELYHVSGSGLTGGASRALVFLNFPLALVAIPTLVLLTDRLSSRSAELAALIGVVLSAAVFWPGVVSEADLDAKPVNAIAALGVLTALALTLFAATRLRRATRPARQPGDVLRLALALGVLAVGLPWMAAELGFFLNGVPVLGSIFQSGPYLHRVGLPPFPPAVHHGHHHGMDGILIVLSALLLSRRLGEVRARWLRSGLTAYLALMICYGVGNIANDFWIEQVVKRGWTSWEIPNVLEPRTTGAWGIIALCTAGLWGIARWRERRRPSRQPSPRPEAV
jgi:hypothetical protein